MQCKDIADEPILTHVATHGGIGCNWFNLENNPRSVIYAMPLDTPEKLVLAKMQKLIKRKLVDGCCCGCRGDFEITPKGLEFITTPVPTE